MANIFQRFLELIPSEPEFVGTVTYAAHPNYKVLLVDGTGLVACTSSTPFNVNDRVFVQGNSIVRTASSGSVILIEI